MINTSIFDFIGTVDDPVFQMIEQLRPNDEVEIECHRVRLTDKFYEIESDEVHLGFKDKYSCYQYLNGVL